MNYALRFLLQSSQGKRVHCSSFPKSIETKLLFLRRVESFFFHAAVLRATPHVAGFRSPWSDELVFEILTCKGSLCDISSIPKFFCKLEAKLCTFSRSSDADSIDLSVEFRACQVKSDERINSFLTQPHVIKDNLAEEKRSQAADPRAEVKSEPRKSKSPIYQNSVAVSSV